MKPRVNQDAVDAIKKKLLGKKLSYQEIFSVMDEISHERLGPILTTYFAAAGFQKGFSPDELYYMTKAMVETGDTLHFDGIVADKHSIGGVAGTRTTMILVPIIAAAGYLIPKNSSRAITSPAGTADTMEVLAPVSFTPRQIEKMVNKVGGCIVYGGHLGLAPADDVMIQVEEPLAFESFDKAIIAIMAKKIASGANHVIFDIPVGPTMKVQHMDDAAAIAEKFQYLAHKFNMNIYCDINEIRQNAGRGIGPALEARDVLEVLEQDKNRPLALEAKALRLAGELLNLCQKSEKSKAIRHGDDIAKELLQSGKALEKMREIIKIQGGNEHIRSRDIKVGSHTFDVKAEKKGRVTSIDNKAITVICRILGCPIDKKAGILLERRLEDQIDKHDILYTLYATDSWRLKEAVETLKNLSIYRLS